MMESVIPISEEDFRKTFLEAADRLGWKYFTLPDWFYRLAFRQMKEAEEEGIKRKYEWPHPGFPDVVLVRRERLMFVELKSNSGRVRADQQEWIDALGSAFAEVYVWRPRDWDEIEAKLV